MMRQTTTGSVYHETYHYYLDQLTSMRFDGKEEVLGISVGWRRGGGALFRTVYPIDC